MKWIKASERLPKVHQPVCCKTNYKRLVIAELETPKRWDNYPLTYDDEKIIEWLDESPSGEQGQGVGVMLTENPSQPLRIFKTMENKSVEGIKTEEIPKPIGEFILAQKDIPPIKAADGNYYHYADVVSLVMRYAQEAVGEKERECEGLKEQIIILEHETHELKEDVKYEQEKKQRIFDLTKTHRNWLRTEIQKVRDQRDHYKALAEAAEAMYDSARSWWEKELSMEGFENLSNTYDKYQALKQTPITEKP